MVRIFTLIVLFVGFKFQIHAFENENAYNVLYDSVWQLWDAGKTEDALRISESIITQFTNYSDKNSKVFDLIGYIYHTHGDFVLATTNYLKAIEIETDSTSKATVLCSIANIYTNVGDYQKAIMHYHKALLLLPDGNSALKAIIHNNIGYAYLMTLDWKRALRYFQMSARVCDDNNIPTYEHQYINLAYSCHKLGLLDTAMMYYEKAFDNVVSIEGMAVLNLDYANILSELNRGDEAFEYYQTACQESIKLPEGNTNRFKCLIDFGAYYVREKEYAKGLELFNEARLQHAPATHDINRIELYHAFARAYEGLAGEHNSTDTLEMALHYLDTAISQVSTMCSNIISQESILKLSEVQNGLYKTGVRMAHAIYEQTGNLFFAERAFHYAEREKYATLTHTHNRNEASRSVSIPDSLLFQQAQLKTRLTDMRFSLEQAAAKGLNTMQTDSLKEHIFTTAEQLEQLVKHIETQYPDYRKFKYLDTPVRVLALQQYLPPEQMLIEYTLHDTAGYAFIIGSDAFYMYHFTADSVFYRHLASYQSVLHSVESLPYDQYKESARYVYNILLRPFQSLLSGKKELLIIPDIALSKISFETLLMHDYHEIPMKLYKSEEPYLLREYAISYAYSANVLVNTKNREFPFWRRFISFTPDYSHSPDSLLPLPEAVPWSKKIARWYLGKSLVGTHATETRFKADNDYGIINFFAHGLDDSKGSSRIYLCPNDSLNDSYLYTHEVNAMNIDANLVALVSCYSGRGEAVRGEGLLSMGRSFTLAGSASVVSSLWAAAIDPSMLITREFFRQLRLGRSKPRAMQLAKLKFLEGTDSVHAHPRKWSGVVVFGNTHALYSPLVVQALIWLSVLALVTVVVRNIVRRR